MTHMNTKKVKVTAIIPTVKWTKEYCELAVESLRKSVDWDIIVVSNGIQEQYPINIPAARRLHTRDQGQCIAVNIGAQMVAPNTDYIFIANDDMYFAPDWAANLRFDYPVFSPNLIEPTNNNGSAPPFEKLDAGFTLDEFSREEVDKAVRAATLIRQDILNLTLDRTELLQRGEDSLVTEVDKALDSVKQAFKDLKLGDETGFNFPVFIRKDVWDTIGGYDTKYDPWGSNSDTDLQTLIDLAGIQPMRLRDVLVYHFSNKSGTFDGSHQEDWQRNWNYYAQKWGFTRDDEPKPDTWMARDVLNKELNGFHPPWEGKYRGE